MKTCRRAILLSGILATCAYAQGRRPGDEDVTVSSTGKQIPAKDYSDYGTGPSSPNSQGLARNPAREPVAPPAQDKTACLRDCASNKALCSGGDCQAAYDRCAAQCQWH